MRNRRIAIGLALSVGLAALFVASISTWQHFSGESNPYAGLNWPVFIFLIAYTVLGYGLIVWLGVGKWGGVRFTELHWWGSNRLADVVIGLSGGLLAAVVLFGAGWLLKVWSAAEFFEHLKSFSLGQRFLFLLIGLNAALIEESLFRGFLQTALVEKLGLPLGVILCSFVFAAYHLNFHPIGFGGKLILGLVFGLLRGKNRPLIRCSIAHALTWVIVGAL